MKPVYGIMCMESVPNETYTSLYEFQGETYIYEARLYMSREKAIARCDSWNKTWLTQTNPADFYIASIHDDRYVHMLTQRDRQKLQELDEQLDTREYDFTKYWKKLQFHGPYYVQQYDLDEEQHSVPNAIPEHRKLEV